MSPKSLELEIIEAVGRAKKFTPESKKVFAENVASQVLLTQKLAQELKQQVETHKQLRKRLNAARRSMGLLRKEIAGSIDGRTIDTLAINELVKKYEIDVGAQLFLEYIITYQKHLNATQPAKQKPGKNTTVTTSLANVIAIHYFKCFGVLPAVTKTDANEPSTTPFMRVCKVVVDYLGFSISYRVMANAVNKLKK